MSKIWRVPWKHLKNATSEKDVAHVDMQNGSASLFCYIQFHLKPPEIWYIFKTSEKA